MIKDTNNFRRTSQNSPTNEGIYLTENHHSEVNSKTFLPQHGHYRFLKVYAVTEIIYDVTYYFAHTYLRRGDRTIDQMIQAARSGKQNIAEGNQAACTSLETELKLTNVAKASLEELLIDYEDYLRTRSLEQWGVHHTRYGKMREYARSEQFMNNYATLIKRLNSEEIANLCITLIHQAIYMLHKLIITMQERFVTDGGIKERMYQARANYRSSSKYNK
jgi:four helix bundle suffix protein